ncbi:MAG: hypothetical protein ACE5QW_09635 [Thermoplasmata archaeon]
MTASKINPIAFFRYIESSSCHTIMTLIVTDEHTPFDSVGLSLKSATCGSRHATNHSTSF